MRLASSSATLSYGLVCWRFESCNSDPLEVGVRHLIQLVRSLSSLVNDRGIRHVARDIEPEIVDTRDLEENRVEAADHHLQGRRVVIVFFRHAEILAESVQVGRDG